MKAYFDRHQIDKHGKGWGIDSKGYQAWLLWGGDAGRRWANTIVANAMTPNDFLAEPDEFSGGRAMGTVEYPGFHTASDKDTTYGYAQQKVVDRSMDPDDRITDYPVVVTLDMAGMRPHVDYDAVKMVLPSLIEVAKQAVEYADPEPIDGLQSYLDGGGSEMDRLMPEDAASALFEWGSSVTLDPSGALMDFTLNIDDPNGFLTELAKGNISDDDLMVITGQFRYVDDVSADRIVAVDYVAPWWPDVLDFEDVGPDVFDEIEAGGWNIANFEDVAMESMNPSETTVYERKAPAGARIEYHGTSYRNLLRAAPHMQLPVPPIPYTSP